MTIALPMPAGAAASAWRRHLVWLAGVAAAILLLFRADVADLTRIWWTSTTFGHCLFIVPVVAWLVWVRRHELAQLTPVAWWPGLAAVAAGGAGWLLGEAAGVAFARQLGLVMMLQGAVVALLGPNVARGLLFPLAYAAFMVPFGEWMEPPLQQVTVSMLMPLLHLAGIPASVDGVLIHAGRYYFEVAEACSGAKFVLAMLAYGALVANVCFRSWQRRALFMALCVLVPVLANALRAFGTIVAAHLTDVETATGVDHIVYGWVFFALTMVAVMAVAWRWFDRAPDDPAFDPAALSASATRTLPLAAGAALALGIAALFAAWGAAASGRSQPLPPQIALPEVAGWHRVPLSEAAPWQPYYPAADHYVFGRYADANGQAVDLALAVFAGQREGKELVAFGTGVLREGDRWVRVADLPPIAGGRALRIVAPGPVERVVATWYRAGGIVTGSPSAVKLATLKANLLGGAPAAVAVHVSAETRDGDDARAAIDRFVAALGPMDAIADRVTR